MGYGQSMGQMLDPMALYDAEQAYKQAQNKQQSAQALTQKNLGALGGLGILASGLGQLLANHRGKKTQSAQSEFARQQFAHNQQNAQQDRDRQAAALSDKRAREDKIAQRNHGYDLDLAGAKKIETTLVRNLISQGLQPNTPEFQQAIKSYMNKKTGTTVNVGGDKSKFKTGAVPKGQFQRINPNTGYPELVNMQGGEQENNKIKETGQRKASVENEFANFGDLDTVINKTLGNTNSMTAGLFGTLSSNVAGSSANDLKSNLNTIMADSAFDTLIKLKAAGGTLGAISKSELDLLKAKRAALNQDQSPEQLRENLLRYQAARKTSLSRVAEGYKEEYGNYPKGFEPVKTDNIQSMSDEDLMRALNAN